MMTLEQIRNIRFHKAKRDGYQPEEVDTFIENVVAAFDAVLSERSANKKKIETLEKDLAACRARESSVGEALLTAQHQADIVLSEAQSRAELMREEARLQAAEIVAGTKGEVEEQKKMAEMLRQEVTAFKGRLLQLYREHLTLIDALPETRNEPQEESQPETAAPETEETAEVPETVEAAEPETEPEDLSSGFDVNESAAVEETSAAAETAKKKSLVDWLNEDDTEEYEKIGESKERYNSLQFGDDYEENARSGGLFRKKK